MGSRQLLPVAAGHLYLFDTSVSQQCVVRCSGTIAIELALVTIPRQRAVVAFRGVIISFSMATKERTLHRMSLFSFLLRELT